MTLPSIVQDIYNEFIEYFGVHRVDIQHHVKYGDDEPLTGGFAILVHWPEVEITNEQNERVVIWDLYCKTIINNQGQLKSVPLFNRATYNKIQWDSDYLHSHVCGICKIDLRKFRTSCLGNGPINHTITKLKGSSYSNWNSERNSYDEYDYRNQELWIDMTVWSLYCWELDKYAHIESLDGGPYRKIRNIGTVRNNINDNSLLTSFVGAKSYRTSDYTDLFKEFTLYIIKIKLLSFNYTEGSYGLATSFTDTVLNVSNAFIEWYNKSPEIQTKFSSKTLINNKIIREVIVGDNYIVYKGDGGDSRFISRELTPNIGMRLFTFKDQDVLFRSIDMGNVPLHTTYILELNIIYEIIYKILRFVNIKYGKSKTSIDKAARIL